MNSEEIKFYLFELVKSLEFVHSQGIIHRDIKPHNVLIDREKRILRLIDFGQAEFYVPDKPLNFKVGALNYKAPEILLG